MTIEETGTSALVVDSKGQPLNLLARLACKGFGVLEHRPSLDLYLVAKVVGDLGAAPDGRPGAWVVGLDLAGKLARSYVNEGARRWGVVEGLPTICLEDKA